MNGSLLLVVPNCNGHPASSLYIRALNDILLNHKSPLSPIPPRLTSHSLRLGPSIQRLVEAEPLTEEIQQIHRHNNNYTFEANEVALQCFQMPRSGLAQLCNMIHTSREDARCSQCQYDQEPLEHQALPKCCMSCVMSLSCSILRIVRTANFRASPQNTKRVATCTTRPASML